MKDLIQRAISALAIALLASLVAPTQAIAGNSSTAPDPVTYEGFETYARMHEHQLRTEGATYMVGGGIALGTSLGLGIASTDVLSKIGYTLIQVLGSASLFYGASLLSVGDPVTQSATLLGDYDRDLRKLNKLSESQRKWLLDQATRSTLEAARDRERTVRHIRGYLELTTAGSSGLSLAFSQVHATASNVALSFVLVISTAGGLADLLTEPDLSGFKSLTPKTALIPSIAPGYDLRNRGPVLALNVHW